MMTAEKESPAESKRRQRLVAKQVKATYDRYFKKQAGSTPAPEHIGGDWMKQVEAAAALLAAYRVGLQEFTECVTELKPDPGVLYLLVRRALQESDDDVHSQKAKAKAEKHFGQAKKEVAAMWLKAKAKDPKLTPPQFVEAWEQGYATQGATPPLAASTVLKTIRKL